MTGLDQSTPGTIDNSWKQFTCQASYCKYNDKHAHCMHKWMELDDHGICIFFVKRD